MTEQRIIFALLANQIKDIHHAISEYILSAKYRNPKWEVLEREGKPPLVERLAPLLNLGMILQELADEERLRGMTEVVVNNVGDGGGG